jgi:membrane protease YdiL (CAAX protease family)
MIGAVDEVAAGSRIDRRRAAWEILLLLGVSLGESAIYSLLRLVERLTRNVPLAQQTSTLNASATPDRPWLDLAYQLVGIAFALVPAILALYLLQLSDPPAGERIGFDLHRPAFDISRGLLLAVAVGLPGLGLYVGARELGWNTQVQASGLAEHWWTIPVLILSAAQNAVVEEVIMIGFLFTRFSQLEWRVPIVVAASAAMRGGYHLYQGFGGLLGNLIMGVVFGLVYLRWKRVGPLVVAHAALDIAAFVGYALLAPRLSWL